MVSKQKSVVQCVFRTKIVAREWWERIVLHARVSRSLMNVGSC